jgi:geranylgeranyl diphosphate synthase type II
MLLEFQIQQLESRLDELIPEKEGGVLSAAARHILFSPSKRLRPLLLIHIAGSYGVELSAAIDPACALEMVHTYSLIHDDLPCMDDAVERRGRPSLHRVFSEGHALLTGDFLLTYAFELLASSPHVTAEQRVALVRTLGHYAGAEGMVGGQVIDLAMQLLDFQGVWEDYASMLTKKTAALFACAFEIGGILGQASSENINSLRQAGLAYGLAFQIQDDIVDGDGCLKFFSSVEANALMMHSLHSAQSALPGPCSHLQLTDLSRNHFPTT